MKTVYVIEHDETYQNEFNGGHLDFCDIPTYDGRLTWDNVCIWNDLSEPFRKEIEQNPLF